MAKSLPKTIYIFEAKSEYDTPYFEASETAEGCSPADIGAKRVVGFYKLAEELVVTNAAVVNYRRVKR